MGSIAASVMEETAQGKVKEVIMEAEKGVSIVSLSPGGETLAVISFSEVKMGILMGSFAAQSIALSPFLKNCMRKGRRAHELRNEVKKFVEEETVAVPKLALGEVYAQLIKLSGVGVTGLVTRAIQRSAEKVAAEFMQNLTGKLQPGEIPDVICAFLSLGRWGSFRWRRRATVIFCSKQRGLLLCPPHLLQKACLLAHSGFNSGFHKNSC